MSNKFSSQNDSGNNPVSMRFWRLPQVTLSFPLENSIMGEVKYVLMTPPIVGQKLSQGLGASSDTAGDARSKTAKAARKDDERTLMVVC